MRVAAAGPFLPVRFGLGERVLRIYSRRRVLVRREPGQHKRHAIAFLDRKRGHGSQIFAMSFDWAAKDESVRPGDRLQGAVDFPDPRHDVSIIEPNGELHPDRDGSPNAFDDPDDVRRLAPRRHKIDQPDCAGRCLQLRLEN